VWDETIVLPSSEIGEVAAFARRHGTTWFVAVLNGGGERSLRLDLPFLKGNRYEVLTVSDRRDDAAAVRVEKRAMDNPRALEIAMRAGGGFIARLTTGG